MINKSAFRNLSYGLYLVTSMKDGKPVGCVVNTFAQVTSDPPQVSIAINKDNYTTQGILETKRFEVSVLHENASMELIGTFGFHTSKDTDKFANFEHAESSQGLPYITEQICAHFSVAVTQSLDLGSHMFFVGDVVEAEVASDDNPMTYAYYHQVKGGRTPKNASSFSTDVLEQDAKVQEAAEVNSPIRPEESKKTKYAWRCSLCGYTEYVDELPDDFTCPICGATKEFFERIEVED